MVIDKNREDFFVTKKIVLLFMLQLLGALFFGPLNGYGENGALTFFKNYTPGEYRMQPQNWDILQDKHGIIYVANQGSLLEFDGVSWKDIDIPNLTARSLAVDDSGTIYVGGKSEIGFLAPGPKGALKYKSLLHHLAVTKKNFGPVWRTINTKEDIYFWTSKFLFRWDPAAKQMKVWEAESVYTASFSCKEHFYIRQESIGLMKMINESLVLLTGGEKFATVKLYMMVPYGPGTGKLLIGTRSMGFYIFDGITSVPFPTGADDYLKEKQLYHGIRLSSGDFALATRLGGLVILNAKARLKEIFNKASGLPGNNVRYVFEDFQGNLWLALDTGITKIEYASPFSIYDDKRSNLPGIVLSAAVHGPHRQIFAGTTSGLYSLAPEGKFLPVPGMSGICWSLLPTGDSLLAATGQGIFLLNKSSQKRIIETSSFVLSRSRRDTNRIWVGTRWGLASLYLEKENNRWIEECKFEKIAEKIGTIIENKHGSLWLGTETGSAIKVEFPIEGTVTEPVVTRYGPGQGLPPGEVHVFFAAGHVIFATKKGVYRFDEKNRVFNPDPIFGKKFADGSRSVFRIVEDNNKNIWFHSKRRNFQAVPQADGTYKINEKTFRRLPPAQVNAIYPDPGGDIIWFAGHNGLVRYDTTVKKNYHHDFPTLIRKVWLNGNLAFDGCKYKTGNDSRGLFPIIDYKDRNLRFEFAAPFFEDESATQYQCLLEGYNEDWTAWNKETKKDYTNLDAGVYTFRVRAKNVYEHVSEEAAFQFKVLPPWYKTWWAFLIYGLGFLLLMFLAVKWRSKYLENEKQELEKIVKDRTKEIEEQKRQLEKQTVQLAEQSEKLKEMDKVKSRFFANISHEFRTPITLIMGPLEQMLSTCPGHDRVQKKKLRMMLRNCQRLLRLINQLLELANFESGTMKLQSRPRNIIPFLKGIIASFELLTDQEELDLIFHAEEEDITLYLDDRKIEDVICNLLINAIKYTPALGKITVSCVKDPTKKVNYPSGSVKISVSDTGPGIPREKLADIFDRFYQSESTYEHYPKGFGIGLAIAKELVELHHGVINVHSTEGQGTEFIIELPLGDRHLKPDEIIDLIEESVTPSGPGKIPAPDMVKAEKEEEEPEEEIEQEITVEEAAKDIILVVEDSVDMRDYIKSSLEPQYRVVEAIDGRDGIEKAREIIPDLIISDIMMPQKDGYELCRELKNQRDTSHIPIILLTAKAAEENIIQGLETGADDYITKPFNTRILCARIKNLVDLRRHIQETFHREMTLKPVQKSVSQIDKEFVKDLQVVINKNISDPEFNVEELCKRLYMGRTTLYRKILALTGEPPTEFIRSYRLKRGAELLKKGMGSVLEVAFEVGFSSANYFSKCFKKKFHQLPSSFQASEAKKEL